MANLTQAQRDKLAEFRFTYPDDRHQALQQMATTQAQLALWQLIDDAHAHAMLDLLDLIDARIQSKFAGFPEDQDGDGVPNDYELVHGGSHPRNGGTDPTDWLVRFFTTSQVWNTASPFVTTASVDSVKSLDGLTTFVQDVDYTVAPDTPSPGQTTLTATVETSMPAQVRVHFASPGLVVTYYSHTVNWDQDATILSWEDSWTKLHSARFNQYWGSSVRLANFQLAISILQQLVTILDGREKASEDLRIQAYTTWNTDEPLSTRQPVVQVTSSSEDVVYQPGVHYTFTPDEDDPQSFSLEVLVNSQNAPQLPASVRARVP